MSNATVPAPALTRTAAGAGPGLVLAHGAGGSVAANFGPILDGLAGHNAVVGVDFPGSGVTPRRPQAVSADWLADELIAAADAAGLEQFAVSGWSLGGAVAIRAAARHPERVTALVLTASFAKATRGSRWPRTSGTTSTSRATSGSSTAS